ncbi:MAG: Uncharacterized protein K0R48_755 [Gammaproteobacteria bacterium]|nr:Uncharacterized protein [Gammaproteobacteria bacterium]
MKKKLWKTAAIFTSFVLCLTGCANLGPRQLPIYQYDYNNSLNYGLNQELLLNIVRFAYGDTPYFLTVSSISTQLELSASASGSASIARHTPDSPLYGRTLSTYTAAPSISYTQRPTITYIPMQGDEFAHRMLTPIEMGDLNNFSAWSIARTLRVNVQSVGNLINAENSSRPTSDTAPHYYQSFIDFSYLFRSLQQNFKADMVVIKVHNKLAIQVSFKDMQDPETLKAFAMLGVSTKYNHIIFVQSDRKGVSGNVVNVKTRSFLEILYYFSKSVQIPPEHLKAGFVDITKNPNGTAFDWQKVTQGMMVVRYSKSMPKNAAVAIYYRDYWFYIADNDQDSKKSLSMLSQLYALLSKDVSQNQPVLTLPV